MCSIVAHPGLVTGMVRIVKDSQGGHDLGAQYTLSCHGVCIIIPLIMSHILIYCYLFFFLYFSFTEIIACYFMINRAVSQVYISRSSYEQGKYFNLVKKEEQSQNCSLCI